MSTHCFDAEEQVLVQDYAKRREILAQEQAVLLQRLSKLSAKMVETQSQYGRVHNSRISAISCLPNQILSSIFEILHRSQPLVSPTISTVEPRERLERMSQAKQKIAKYCTRRSIPNGTHHSSTRAEVPISQVCKRWREITLDRHSLWSVFWCDKPTSLSHLHAEKERLHTYLSRSGHHDLELYLDFACRDPEPESSESTTRFKSLVAEMLGVAVLHAHRWRNFTLLASDTIQRVSLAAFRRKVACIYAPRLERLVVCTGATDDRWDPSKADGEESGDTWEPQILLFSGGGGVKAANVPCPALRYLKLDNGGLTFCRPPIHNLTHLILESGPCSAHGFKVEWPLLLSTDILRSPHLESLSLSDTILDESTFPLSHTVYEEPEKYHLDFPLLKHFRVSGSYSQRGAKNSFLWFLLRCVSAINLETLTLSTFKIENSPWNIEPGEWLAPSEEGGGKIRVFPQEVFPSLQALTLIDLAVSTQAASYAAFLRLAWMTASARTVVISAPFNDEGLDMISILGQRGPWEENQIPLDSLWPGALDISLDLSPGSEIDEENCLQWYMQRTMYLAKLWKSLEVVRIPPLWLDTWLSRLNLPAKMDCSYWTLPYYTWSQEMEGLEFDPEEYLSSVEPEEKEVVEGGLEEKDTMTTTPQDPGRRPIRIEPIRQTLSHLWPPDSGSTKFNTLQSECFDPFKIEIARSDISFFLPS